MFNDFKSFFGNDSNKVMEISRGKLLPLLRWFSFSTVNLKEISRINKTAFWIPHEAVYGDIYLNVNKGMRFIKYLKKQKVKDKEVLISCLKKIYSCGKSELEKNWDIIEPQLTKDKLLEMAVMCGLNNKEAKGIGVKLPKIKAKEIKKKPRGLLSF